MDCRVLLVTADSGLQERWARVLSLPDLRPLAPAAWAAQDYPIPRSRLMVLDSRDLAGIAPPSQSSWPHDGATARELPRLVALAESNLPRHWVAPLESFSPRYASWSASPEDILELATDQPGGIVGTDVHAAPPYRLATSTSDFVTRTPHLIPILEQLTRIAAHDVTLLLIGETGTGKTTLAHLMHELSSRAGERFMTVACGALPPDLIESELFGHVRGAFTGAERAKIGRFEATERGTLLLDEIDVLSPKEQAKLLRVIETGEFEPVGSTETRQSQARLIVASNVDLQQLVEAGQFRSDLYYRLNVLEFHLPPLRDRPHDLVPLAMRFADDLCREHGVTIEHVGLDFLAAIRHYAWPGNLRELKNQIRRAVLFARQGQLRASDLALHAAPGRPAAPVAVAEARGGQESGMLAHQVADREREILEQALRAHNFKRTAAARSLGISRVGLYKKMRKYGMLNTGD